MVKIRHNKLSFGISKEYKFMFRENHAVTTGEHNYHYVLVYLGVVNIASVINETSVYLSYQFQSSIPNLLTNLTSNLFTVVVWYCSSSAKS